MRTRTWGFIGLTVVLATALTAHGQQITPIDIDSVTAGETAVWGNPADSGSTQGIFLGQTDNEDPYQLSQAVPNTGLWCPGGADGCLTDPAYEIGFAWRDPTDLATTGVRCSSSFATNFNRPSIHLGGKIRFRMAVTAFDFAGDISPNFPIGFQDLTGNPSIFMCLAVRETGKDLPLGASDTGGGDIELVYLPLSEVIPAATTGFGTTNGFMADTVPGQNIANGGKRYNATTDLWPPEDDDFAGGAGPGGIIEFDLGALTSAQIRGFANNLDGTDTAGDGKLDATLNPNGNGVNRGTLEAIIFTNDPNNAAIVTGPGPGEYFFMYVDDLVLEAPVDDPTPVPTVVAPILRNATQVTVTDLSTNATLVELKVGGITNLTTNAVPLSGTFVFDLPAPAVPGDVYTAAQTVDGVSSIDSNPVTVSFPGPAIGLLPKDGDTTVLITGIDAEADAVELFVDAVSRGITTNGNTTLPFSVTVPAGAALVMGEEITATQSVTGGTSDLSPVSIVTTNSITEVFCDDFEYANQAAFDGVWEAHAGDTQLVLSSAKNATTGLPLGTGKSAYSAAGGSGEAANQSQLITEFGATVGTDTHPTIFNITYFDGLENSGLYRQQAELRASGLTTPLIALGKTNQIGGNFHSARLVAGPGWINLDGYGQPPRTNGWHVLTAAIKSNTVDIYVDGTLAAINESFTASAALATALIGSGLSSVGGDAYYDDLCVKTGAIHFNEITTQPPPPPTVVAPILPGAASVSVIDIDSNSTEAALYVNGGLVSTQGLVDQTSASFTVGSAISNDVYTATQTQSGLESEHSDPVTVLLPAPILYKASRPGETSVRVLDLDPNATLVEVLVNSNSEGSVIPTNGVYSVVVPLTTHTLQMGEIVTAKQFVGAIESVESVPDTVTTSVIVDTLVCSDFDSYADQTAFEVDYEAVNFPASPGESIHILNTDGNATTGGMKSVKTLTGAQYRTTPKGNPFPGIQGTDLTPAVFNISIYDPTAAPGPDEWASLVNWDILGGGTDFFLAELGLATAGFTGGAETHYQARLIGNGPFNWFQLDQLEGPERSVGWHAFTMVFKGPAEGNATGHEVDIYVDGLLARKNMVLVDDTLLVTPMIGSGQTSTDGAWYDDFCAELGPVRFNELAPPCPTFLGDADRDGDIDLADGSALALCVDGPLAPLAIECWCADLDTNGAVDLKDYSLMQEILNP